MSEYKINIVHLYPDLLNLYGDKGNIECLRKRLMWRGIDVNVSECTDEIPEIDFENTDIIFLGGGSDREQEIVCSRLLKIKKDIKKFIENNGTFLAFCGGFELLGKSYGKAGAEKEALGVFDFNAVYSENNSRLIGNVIIEHPEIEGYIVGFENHSGRIDISGEKPLGNVKVGYGSDGKGETEGLTYKNLYATYLHGPLLPKNPKLCDLIIGKTVLNKYPDFGTLKELDDEMEEMANRFMVERLLKN